MAIKPFFPVGFVGFWCHKQSIRSHFCSHSICLFFPPTYLERRGNSIYFTLGIINNPSQKFCFMYSSLEVIWIPVGHHIFHWIFGVKWLLDFLQGVSDSTMTVFFFQIFSTEKPKMHFKAAKKKSNWTFQPSIFQPSITQYFQWPKVWLNLSKLNHPNLHTQTYFKNKIRCLQQRFVILYSAEVLYTQKITILHDE